MLQSLRAKVIVTFGCVLVAMQTIPCSCHTTTNQPVRSWLVVDFDGTCTLKDTTSFLPKIASLRDEDGGDSRMKRWQDVENEYFQAYNALKSRLLQENESRIIVSLEEALDELDTVSIASTRKVSEQKLLSGVPTSRTEMKKTLSLVNRDVLSLQAGCKRTISRALHEMWEFRVLSINWSKSLIDYALVHPLNQSITPSINLISEDVIWSNNIDDQGQITLTIPGAVEKREQIRSIRRIAPNDFIVYIGDSATDLLALLEADIGIVVGNSQSTIDIAERWGLELVSPLSKYTHTHKNIDHHFKGKNLWKADHWDEIDQLLSMLKSDNYGLDPESSPDL